jgi:hypothetical protein
MTERAWTVQLEAGWDHTNVIGHPHGRQDDHM